SAATAGVGSTPARSTSAPSAHRPATSAASSIGPERRVSRPTTNGRVVPSTRAAARPTPVTSSGVSSRLASPRMPSVPNRRVMGRSKSRGDARRSPLRVLRSLARLLQSVLATLLLTGVARQQTRLLERRPHLLVERYQRTRDPEPERAG